MSEDAEQDAAREALRLAVVIERQYRLLGRWLRALDADDALPLTAPSSLEGWTVAELVTHIGRGMSTIGLARLADPGVRPITLSAYVSAYPLVAEETAEVTRQLEREVGDTRLEANDAVAEQAFAQLAALAPLAVVQALRGPLTAPDFFMTRLFELIVHAEDLAASIPGAGDAALDEEALALVAEAFAAMTAERLGGQELQVKEPRGWVRLAAGRVPLDERSAAVVRLPGTAEPLEQLRRAIPLF